MPFFVARINLTKIIYKAVQFCDIFFHACVCYFLLKKSFITGTSTLQPLYLLYIHAILIPNWGNIEIAELEIPSDHVHMIVKSEPKVSPSDIMQIIKSISARNFFKLYPQIKRKYFWGGKLWTQSFFVETVGNTNDKVIREYVQNQLNAMDKMEKAATQLKLF